MPRTISSLLFCVAIIGTLQVSGDAPAKQPSFRHVNASNVPVGVWKVEFANGVNEVCHVSDLEGGHATVEEPLRRSRGTVIAKEGSFVMTFEDDRIERWTPVGTHFVVEHWFPGSQLPTVTPVLGIAGRAL